MPLVDLTPAQLPQPYVSHEEPLYPTNCLRFLCAAKYSGAEVTT